MNKLKPCPFCGGTDLNLSHVNEIWCKSCGGGMYSGDHSDNTKTITAESWNMRDVISIEETENAFNKITKKLGW